MDNNSENGRENAKKDSGSVDLSSRQIEKAEEDKLKAKYPMVSGWPVSGHSVFLQKKLAKGKYFDSGDYQMAKQTSGGVNKAKSFPTGGEIPTPDTVPARKTSIIQPKFNPTVQ